jgi:hypothetical protein
MKKLANTDEVKIIHAFNFSSLCLKLPVLKISLQGESFNCLLETGSEINIFSRPFKNKIDLGNPGVTQIKTLTGTEKINLFNKCSVFKSSFVFEMAKVS